MKKRCLREKLAWFLRGIHILSRPVFLLLVPLSLSAQKELDSLSLDELLHLAEKMDTANSAAIRQVNVEYFKIDSTDSRLKTWVVEKTDSAIYKRLGLPAGRSADTLRAFARKIDSYPTLHNLCFMTYEDLLRSRNDDRKMIQFSLRTDSIDRAFAVLDQSFRDWTIGNYHMYAFRDHVNQSFHSFRIYHDNDFLALGTENHDRDYTGGFRLEVTTDRLKMPLIRPRWGYSALSYQSFFIGGEGYTPYAHFSKETLEEDNVYYSIDPFTGYLTPESLDSISLYLTQKQQATDRPYASFQYFGRGKYRLHCNGVYRSSNLTKIGFMGKNLGADIQAVIHQDVNSGTQRILNWGRQIAHGGRLVFSCEGTFDLSILSRRSIWDPKGITGDNENRKKQTGGSIRSWINFYIPVEYAWGTATTYIGGGIGYSTHDFLMMNGFNDPKLRISDIHLQRPVRKAGQPKKEYYWSYVKYRWKIVRQHINLSAELKNRRVFHNSMLEGPGFLSSFPDDPLDNEATTVYSLSEKQVANWLMTATWRINIRLRSMTLFYGCTYLLNREFFVARDPSYNAGLYETPKRYGWGTIGCNFYLTNAYR